MSERIDKLEVAVRKLAGDVGEIRAEQRLQGKQLAQLNRTVADLADGFSGMATAIKDIQKSQAALANAMTSAIKQLAVDKSLELRMQRLEEAVFGSKH